MSGKSYSINHATNTAIIKDHSFRNCIKLLALAALTCFIVTVLLLCWLKLSNGTESMIDSTTENYGVHDKVVQGGVLKVPGGNNKDKNNPNRRLGSTTPSTNDNRTNYKYIPAAEDAHLHGPNIDDPVSEIDHDYEDTTDVIETDTIVNNSSNNNNNSHIELHKMAIRMEVVNETSYEDLNENSSTDTTPKSSTPELVQLTTEMITTKLQLPILASTTEKIDKLITTNPTISEFKPTTEFETIVNVTATEPSNVTQSSFLIANVQNLTTIPVPTCPTVTNVVTTCPTPLPVCETVECKKSASKILSLLNHESDPCEDFYGYTCSGSHLNKVNLNTEFNEENDIYEVDIDKIDSNAKYIKKYKRFYYSCMNYNNDLGFPLLQKHLKEIHIDNDNVTDKASQLADLLADILKFGVYRSTLRTLPIVDIVMDIGPNGKFIPVITIPMERFPTIDAGDGDFYEKECLKHTELRSKNIDSVGEIYEIYDECMQNVTLFETVLQKSIDELRLFDELPDFERKQKADKMVTLVMWDIGDIGTMPHAEKFKHDDEYEPKYYSLGDLQIYYPEINWQRFFNGVFNNVSFVFDKIKIMYPAYLKNIFAFYSKRDYDEIKSSILSLIAHDFYVEYLNMSVVANTNDRKAFCSKLTINTMKEVSTKLLINQYSDNQIAFKEKMGEKIFMESIALLAESIGNATWLDTSEKNIFINKIKDIRMVGKSTEFYKNPAILAQLYDGIDIQDNLVHNTLAMMKFRQSFMYSLMSKDYLENQYFWTYLVSPLEKSARIIFELNSVVVPFRLLSNSIPNANKMKQKYEIYSKLSYHMSYELASFFSPANIEKFWTPLNEIYKNFAATNLIDPYITHISNPYELELDKDSIKYTLNSRFSDDAAIRIAWETYRWKSLNTDLPLPWLNLTIPQLYYVIFAQQFCYIDTNRVKTAIDTVQSDKLKNYFRLNSVIMNSKNFPDEFECHRGTNMNPSVKLEQFPHFSDAVTYDEITDNAT